MMAGPRGASRRGLDSRALVSALIVVLGVLPLDASSAARGEEPSPPAVKVEPAHFHHVRISTTDRARSIEFYRRHLGAVEVRYRGKVDALLVERSFLLLTRSRRRHARGPAPSSSTSAGAEWTARRSSSGWSPRASSSPDRLLVEIVQEKPIPEGLWE